MFQLAKAKVELEATTTNELHILCAKYEMGEARVKELMAKQREKLNRNVEEALAREWNEWSAQAAKLQIFRVDTKN